MQKQSQSGELWDLFLQVLRTHWEDWKQDGDISFETYMIFTCQQIALFFCRRTGNPLTKLRRRSSD